MPPKTLTEIGCDILKYFETLTLIVSIKRQENQLSLMMTLKLNESGYLKHY